MNSDQHDISGLGKLVRVYLPREVVSHAPRNCLQKPAPISLPVVDLFVQQTSSLTLQKEAQVPWFTPLWLTYGVRELAIVRKMVHVNMCLFMNDYRVRAVLSLQVTKAL